ncbi:DUF2975 domain-containing protein [Pseudaestuariivita atlantica]|uniref:DUF2975 domain-containing protein n=1 Tax=Pseudaestuariivita atlantica TaxID=1317121 RepID=A0A0L1JVN4_9RHOB|nr:DUF2975 domain-containing protein [Pseudaestuariivita atlantica]KNG95428.1 hypothetical protein ATO11_02155 [Pseudaestuariivita atlantica]
MQTPANPAQRFARIASIGCTVAALGVVLAMLFVLVTVAVPRFGFDIAAVFGVAGEVTPLSLPQRAIGAALILAPSGLALWLFILGARLFAGMARGRIFDLDAARGVRRIGWLMVALAPAGMLAEVLGTGALTVLAGIGGQGRVSLSFQAFDLHTILSGLIVVCFGHVLAEAARVDAENRSFV